MTPMKVFLVIIVSVVYTARCAQFPTQIRSLSLRKLERPFFFQNSKSKNSSILSMDVDARRKLCQSKITDLILDKQLGTLRLPRTFNFYVPAGQFYNVDKYNDIVPALRCPTFPALYITEHPMKDSYIHYVNLLNPYLDYEFEFESAINVQEIELSKKAEKGEKGKGEKKQKTPKVKNEAEPSKKEEDKEEHIPTEKGQDDEELQKGREGKTEAKEEGEDKGKGKQRGEVGETETKGEEEVKDKEKQKEKKGKTEAKGEGEDKDKGKQRGEAGETETKVKEEDKDKEKQKEKKGKTEAKGEGEEKNKEKQIGEEGKTEAKGEEEDKGKEKQKGKKGNDEAKEEDKKEDTVGKKSKGKKDKKKKTGKLLNQFLLSKMFNVDIDQRWHLCHMAKELIRYQVDLTTYAGDEDPKIYEFSYAASPSEVDVAFLCFLKPEIYIRVSRSNAEKLFMITFVEPSSSELELLKI